LVAKLHWVEGMVSLHLRLASLACSVAWAVGLLAVALALQGCGSAVVAPWRLAPAGGSPAPALPKIHALGIGDLNRDGFPDIAAIGGDSSQLLVLINQGDGRFAVPEGARRMPIGARANGLAIVDVNGDDAADLIVCYHDRDEVGVLLAKGDGDFHDVRMRTIMTRSHGSPHVHNLAVGDVNHDGRADVLVSQADDNSIAWAFGDGVGGFAPAPETFAAGRHPYTIVVGDWNGDGHLDFASPNSESDDLSVGLGDGASRFTAPPGGRPSIPPRTLALAAGDITGDGIIDFVSNSDVNQRELSLLIGDGRGGFALSEHSFVAPGRCYGQVVTDINRDGMSDVVAPCIDRASVIVWLAQDLGALRFRRMEFATSGTDSQVVVIGDIDKDGWPDVVAAGWMEPSLAVLLGVEN
jgi:hypothetical protein